MNCMFIDVVLLMHFGIIYYKNQGNSEGFKFILVKVLYYSQRTSYMV